MKWLVVSLILAMMAGCPVKKKTTSRHHHGRKHTQVTPAPKVSPIPTINKEYQVDLNWADKWDAMLKKHGDKLPSPKRPGNREGIKVEGDHDVVTQKTMDEFNSLKQIKD